MKTITMKKTIAIALVALGLQLSLNSCSKDEESTPEPTPTPALVLPKKFIFTEASYTSTSTITYNGNKMVEINSTYTGEESGTSKSVYTYTGDLITKVAEYENGVLSDQTDYTYENNKLKSSIYARINGQYKSKGVYVYNPDGTVTNESYSINIATGVETKNNDNTILTFANGNLVKGVSIQNQVEYIFKNTTTYEYDNKNSFLKNVLGFNKLIDDELLSQSNNITKKTVLQESTYQGQAQEPNTYITAYEYVYNSNGYPVKRTYNETANITSTLQIFYE
jgi:filamentous hemagglutinin family protein